MRLKFLAKVLPLTLCSLIWVAAFAVTSYAEECMAVPVHGLGMVACMPEPSPGIITYALGFLGAGIVALRSKLGR
jgi:hypothetical protein